jgi:hypothetical protein
MNKIQINNLVCFIHNITPLENTQKLSQCSPDYVKEVWERWVNVEPVKKEIHKTENIINWIEKWNVSDEQFEELKEIIAFIDSYHNHSYFFIFKRVVNLFEKHIGEPTLIEKDIRFGLHPVMMKKVEEYISLPRNEDYIKILLRNNAFDTLI